MNIKEKLLEIQSELKAPKGQFNKFGNYKYRSCEDILECLKPLLKDVQAVITITDEIVQVGDRYYIKATATLSDLEGSISTTAYAREEETKKGMDASQITGSASSYARKYALNGLFAIDDTKDADATNDHGKGAEKPRKTKATTEEQSKAEVTAQHVAALLSLAAKKGHDETSVKKAVHHSYKISDIKQLTPAQYKRVVQYYEGLPDK